KEENISTAYPQYMISFEDGTLLEVDYHIYNMAFVGLEVEHVCAKAGREEIYDFSTAEQQYRELQLKHVQESCSKYLK
nr:hypothetical protein [Caldisericia bacterium]